ncbi:hypothetical protein RHIZ404_190277 [Rhizobium sp. EC-SD404]|nr:hypothetical protein RHIZ404_190277 [Rhizobium sp. EC-SD404]
MLLRRPSVISGLRRKPVTPKKGGKAHTTGVGSTRRRNAFETTPPLSLCLRLLSLRRTLE